MKKLLILLMVLIVNIGYAGNISTWLGTGLNPITTSEYPERDTGANWKLIASGSQLPWDARVGFGVCVFQEKLWLVGGADIWNSPDGINWTLVSSGKLPSTLTGFGLEVFDNKMWVIGGNTPNADKKVRYSTNGVDWTIATSSFPLASERGTTTMVFNNYLWVADLGYRGWFYIWKSTNGVNWVCVSTGLPFPNDGPSAPNGGSFGGRLFYDVSWPNFCIYTSEDGITWQNTISTSGWGVGHQTEFHAEFNNSLYVISRYSGASTRKVRKISSDWATVQIATGSPVVSSTNFDGVSCVGGGKLKGHMYLINSHTNGTKCVWRSY